MNTSRFSIPPALCLAACASLPPDAGFPDVQALVGERVDYELRWTNSAEEDAAADASIDALLAEGLTSEAAVQVALLNNRDLQAVYEELGVAQSDLVAAGLLQNPMLGAEFLFPEGGGLVELELGITGSLLGILLRPFRQRMAEAAFEATKLRVAGEALQLVGAVRTAFLELLAAQQVFALRRTVALTTGASAELAHRIHEAGNLRDLDLASERAMHEEARLEVAEAELAVVEAREQLNVLMGLWGTRTGWATADGLPELPLDTLPLEGLEARAIERSLELGVARQDLERAARRLGVARPGALARDATIGVGAERGGEGNWSVGPTIELPIPLFDQGQPALARGAAELRALQERYAARAIRIRSDVRATTSRVLALEARARHWRDVLVPLRRDVLEATQLQYNAMQLGGFQLLQAKREEVEANIEHIVTLRDYWLARVDFDQLMSGASTSAARGATVGAREEDDDDTHL